MVIAIDGPAGVGKSTLAEYLAKKWNIIYLNTGRYYRAIVFFGIKENIINDSTEKPLDVEHKALLLKLLRSLIFENTQDHLVVNNLKLSSELHTESIDKWVAEVSKDPNIRQHLNIIFRTLGEKINLVAEGRDMTSVVFPHADIRLFLDASAEVRANRRFIERPDNLTYDQILENIKQRDLIDRNKAVGALKITEGCKVIDSSYLTIQEVCAKVDLIIRQNFVNLGSASLIMADTEFNQTILQEEYLKSLQNLQEGSLIEGTVISVSSDSVTVGIGYKSDGVIPLNEFTVPPVVGDKIKLVLVRKESRNGGVEVSKIQADAIAYKDSLKSAFDNKTSVKGVFTKSIKGGYEVDLGAGYIGFVPLSKADSIRIENPEELVGKKGEFLIEKLVFDKKSNIVLNRRDLLAKETESKREEFFKTKKEGDIVEGEVKSFTTFGAFIDLGGFDGLLHINDMSWGHVTKPKDLTQKGDRIKLKIIKLDPAEKRINLSLKDMSENPWTQFELKYKIGDVVKGKVTKLADFGAFIEVEEGIEGLIHISEMSWIKRIAHPKELLKIGDIVESKILSYDMESSRLSLGLKQVSQNPWDQVAELYPVGKVLNLTVKKVTASAAFLTLQEGIDGYLHADDYSWTKKIRNLASEIKDGQQIDVKVLSIDKESHRIRLGVKQVTEDPWNSLRKTYPRGSVIEGVVVNKTDFGIFVRVPGEIEGLVNKSHLCDSRDEAPEDFMKKINNGDKLKLLVQEVNVEKQKLALSLKDYVKMIQKEEISKYLQDDDEVSNYRLGDFLKK